MNKYIKILLLSLPLVLVANAEANPNSKPMPARALAGDPAMEPLSLQGTKWQPTYILGQKGKIDNRGEKSPFIEFKGDKAYGMSGVNNFHCTFSERGGTLSFGAVGSTRMMGANMALEGAFLDALRRTAKAERKGKELMLLDAKGTLLMALSSSTEKAKDAKPLKLANTKWKTIYIEGAKKGYASVGKGKVPYIEFIGNDKIAGFAGDNVFNGNVNIAPDGSIKLGHLAVTMMMGPNGEYEHSFLMALNKTAKVAIKDAGMLCLFDKKGDLLMQLKPF